MIRTWWFKTTVTAACIAAVGSFVISAAAEGATDFDNLKPLERVSKLGWMRGEWVRDQAGDNLEEIWSAPSGDALFGMFRWSKGGKAWMYELMTITVENDKVFLFLKHFDRRLVGWEEKEDALRYPIKSQSANEVTFENPGQGNPRRFIYRIDDERRFVVRMESEKDGAVRVDEFAFSKR